MIQICKVKSKYLGVSVSNKNKINLKIGHRIKAGYGAFL